MRIRRTFFITALAAVLGGLAVPALVRAADGTAGAPDGGMSMGMDRMGHGMMGGGMTSHGMMSGGGIVGGGCAGMMQSMNSGDGRPNGQWQTHPPGNAAPD